MSIEKLRPSFSFTEDRLRELQAVAPEAFADGKINWDTLREALGNHLECEGEEHFGLTWPGKRETRRLASMPSKGTLVSQPGEGVNEENTHNIFIEGDNLEVLKLLQKSYASRVKVIYIDPPYNTGNDFVYPDDYSEPLEAYLRRTGQSDEAGKVMTTNSKVSGRVHSNWLNMMYPRLLLAKQLLSNEGFLLVSIDDREFHNLKEIINEVFGEENFVGTLIWKRRQMVDSRSKNGISVDHEYLLIYRRTEGTRLRGQDKDLTKYSNPDNDLRGPWLSADLTGLANIDQRPNLHYPLVNPETGITYQCPENGWRYSQTTMSELMKQNKILWPSSPNGRPRLKRFLNELTDEFSGLSTILNTVYNTQGTKELKELFDGKDVFDFPKPVDYIKLLIKQVTSTSNGDIVLDFFAGSGTTAHAVMELNHEDQGNRRFILAQLPELTNKSDFQIISEIGKERIRRAIKKIKKELTGEQDLGFSVFKLQPSHFQDWNAPETTNIQQLEMKFSKTEDPLVAGWKPETFLTEIILLQGFPLDAAVRRLSIIKNNTVHEISHYFFFHRIYACLDETINDETINTLTIRPEDVFICLDSALSDEAKLRFSDRCNLKVI